MVTIRRALAAVKEDLPSLIEHHVQDLATQHVPGHRRRELTPVATVLLFVTQVLHGNTAIHHLRHLASMTVSGTAYCKARARLPLALFTQLLQRVVEHLAPIGEACDHQADSRDACPRRHTDDASYRWRGHRVWRGDGTSFSMPDEPCLRAHFGQPSGAKEGCGFPVATLFVLCNAAGMIIKTLAVQLYTHDGSQLSNLHDALQPGDVLVYDRAGCSHAHLALLLQGNKHAIVRAHQRQIIDFKTNRKHARLFSKDQRAGKPGSQWIKRLGKHDQLVRWFKPKQRAKWMGREQYEQLPDSLVLRELRYSIKHKGFRTKSVTLVTTLLDADQYPKAELAEQYGLRWQIEVDFRHLKQTMNMNVLKCKTVDGVLKELAVFTLVYNLVRLVMLRAAKQQDVPIDRVSFIDALRWLCAIGAATDVDDGIFKHDATPTLIINPNRPGRSEPRVIKRRKDCYRHMTQPRQYLRNALKNKGAGR